MTIFVRSVTLAAMMGLALPAIAQEAAPETTQGEAAQTTPQDAPKVPEPYVKETFGDWELRCVKLAEDKPESCQLYQLLKDKQTGNPIMEITMIALPQAKDAPKDQPAPIAGATVIVPLETLLTQKLNITVDNSEQTRRFDFTFCAEVGCVARIGLTKEDVDAFRRGKVATISVVPVANPNVTVDVDLSLNGFTAGFEAVSKANAAQQ
ncbi:invasion protein IalB [Albidovulum inexpectatum]|uniref:Invasion protein IalB n=1 Tax=Albidovulum inexpectatum TaxID=196587 RepID=A0A2S5JK33_9RHOB|nr:invasion associated locus B family protein [Albidovulum inexpectatum]PPB81877.1 invasion protein IalB [Albidovulum inexpectatum]